MGKKRYSVEFKQLIEEKLHAGVSVSQLEKLWKVVRRGELGSTRLPSLTRLLHFHL